MSIAATAKAEAHDDESRWGEPQEFALLDRDGIEHPFTGWLLASESTEQPGNPRWTVLEGYRTVGGNYILHTLGCSVVYHRLGSSCNTGEPAAGREMEPGLEPCRRCRPAENYASTSEEIFSVEVDIPTVKVSTTPTKFIRSLHHGADELSLVAFRLLRAMQRVDPDIEAARKQSVRRVD